MAETEGIIESIPLTPETLSKVNSQIPHSPSNLLTQKTSVVLPPPSNFDRQDFCTHGADEDKFNMLLGNFGYVREINFFRASRSDKNGIKKTRL